VSVIKPKVAKATGLSDGSKIPGVGRILKVDNSVGSIPNVVKTTGIGSTSIASYLTTGSNLVTVGIGSAQVAKSTGLASIPNVVKTTGSNFVTVGIGSAQVAKSTGLAGVEFVDRSMSVSPQMAIPMGLIQTGAKRSVSAASGSPSVANPDWSAGGLGPAHHVTTDLLTGRPLDGSGGDSMLAYFKLFANNSPINQVSQPRCLGRERTVRLTQLFRLLRRKVVWSLMLVCL
jgi:hypothetical protein